MKFMKKNQVVVAVIGLMLIAAGYLNFTNNSQINSNQLLETAALADSEQMASIGDAKLVSTVPTDTNIVDDENDKEQSEEKNNENTIKETQKENKDEANKVDSEVQTNAEEVTTDEYFTKSRLERETMYSQMIESYQKILSNNNMSESQKSTAQKEIKRINEEKNAIMITENLIKTKGFEDLVIFINDESINAIIKSAKLKSDQIAQIQNIVTRELKAKIENIHISNKE